MKVPPVRKFRSFRDTSWDVTPPNVFKFTRDVLEGCGDLCLAVVTHSAALEHRSRKLVVISRTVHENDDLSSLAWTFLRTLRHWLFHTLIPIRLLDRVKAKR